MKILSVLIFAIITTALPPPCLAQEQKPPAPLESAAAEDAVLPDIVPTPVEKRSGGMEMPILDDKDSVIKPIDGSIQPPVEKPRLQRSADEIFRMLPTIVQADILNESYSVHVECSRYTIYSQLHDCDCVGSRFFEERVFHPEKTKETMVHELSGECASEAGAAGYGYEKCLNVMRLAILPARLEEYCTCYGNKLGESYLNSPSADYGNLRYLGDKTNAYCMKTLGNPLN